MAINEQLEQLKQVKQDIKQALIGKEVDMTDVPFTSYAEKISGIETNYVDVHHQVVTLKGTDVKNGEGIDTLNQKPKSVFMGLYNGRNGVIQGSNDNSTWEDIVTGTTSGSSSGGTGTPKLYTATTEYRYIRYTFSVYNNGSTGILYWGIFAPTSNVL